MSNGAVRQRPQGLIIAVDGPSGAGKSSISRLLAKRLGYLYIDTGAMYRTIALAVKRAAVAADDDVALAEVCRGVDMTFDRSSGCCHLFLNGEDVSSLIRTEEISRLTSQISARKIVRDILVQHQRELGKEGGVILEGRDIGTVVFPDADVKFFLSASVEERGKRRYLEQKARGEDVVLATTIAEAAQRDKQDSCREHAPLSRAGDAIDIDSSALTMEEVLTLMGEAIKGRLKAEA